MSLQIYEQASTDYLVGTQVSDALLCGYNKRSQGLQVKQVYIGNTDPTVWYSNIEIFATHTGAENYWSGANGFGVKMYMGVLEPNHDVWNATPYGNRLYQSTWGTVGEPVLGYKRLWVAYDAPLDAKEGLYPFNIFVKCMKHAI